MSDNSNKKKNIVFNALIFIVVFGITSFACSRCTTQSIADVLKSTVEKINKSCPVFIDEATRLDSTVYIPEKTIMYCYTITDDSITLSDSTRISEYLLPVIIENIKEDKEMKYFTDNNVTLMYNYRLFNKTEFIELTVTPERYK